MTISTYDGTKMMKASCIMSFNLRNDCARLDSIFIACGNLLVSLLFWESLLNRVGHLGGTYRPSPIQ